MKASKCKGVCRMRRDKSVQSSFSQNVVNHTFNFRIINRSQPLNGLFQQNRNLIGKQNSECDKQNYHPSSAPVVF